MTAVTEMAARMVSSKRLYQVGLSSLLEGKNTLLWYQVSRERAHRPGAGGAAFFQKLSAFCYFLQDGDRGGAAVQMCRNRPSDSMHVLVFQRCAAELTTAD